MSSPSGPPVTPYPKPPMQPCAPKPQPAEPALLDGYDFPKGDDGKREKP